jgi:hypothetical protein
MTYNPCENTKITYRGNGSQTDFTFQFTYTDESDVIVWLFDDLKTEWVEQTNRYVFAGPTVIRFLTAPPRPTNVEGYNIIIGRRTNVNVLEATFYPGSSIRAQDLNANFEQVRAGIEDSRCELSSTIENLKYDYWGKISVSKRSSYEEAEPPKDTTYREDQENGYWDSEGDNKSVPTTGAVSARLDPYVQDNLPARPNNDGSETPGKLWINTSEYWDSYWDNDASAWVAFVNTGPRGKDGLNGDKGEIGDTGYINLVGRIGPGAWFDIEPNDEVEGELYVVDAPITGFPGGGVPEQNDAIGWNGTQWYNYGHLAAQGPVGPKGDKGETGETGGKGDKGDTGETGTTDVGTTTTGAPGSNASVVNSGTSQSAVLDFTIPRGDKGEKGETGDKGDPGKDGVVTDVNWSDDGTHLSPTQTRGVKIGSEISLNTNGNVSLDSLQAAGTIKTTGQIIQCLADPYLGANTGSQLRNGSFVSSDTGSNPLFLGYTTGGGSSTTVRIEANGSATFAGKVTAEGSNSAFFVSNRIDGNTLTFSGQLNGTQTAGIKADGSAAFAGTVTAGGYALAQLPSLPE